MSMSGTIVRLSDFRGGEASIFPQSAMPSKYSVLLQNCYINERGNIAKVPGYQKMNAEHCGAQLTSGFEFRKIDGTSMVLAAGGGKIFRLADGNMQVVHEGLDAGARVSFVSINNICIMCNGINKPLQYDGVTVSELGTSTQYIDDIADWDGIANLDAIPAEPKPIPQTAFKAHVHKGRTWWIERANKMLATHSELNNPNKAEGYIDFKFVLKKGDELLDVFTYMDFLVFFFRSHIVAYAGNTPSGTDADFRLVQLIGGMGVVATGTVQELGTDCAFLSDTGIKSFSQIITTGNLNVNDVSKLISTTIMSEIQFGGEYSSAHYPRLGWYLIRINSVLHVYSYVHKAWSRIVGADISGMFGTTEGNLYFTGNGYLYDYGTGSSFSDEPVSMAWKTAWLSFSKHGAKMYPKVLGLAGMQHVDAEINLNYSYDMLISAAENSALIRLSAQSIIIDAITNWDAVMSIDDAFFSNDIRIPMFGGGRIMQLTFTNTSNKPVELSDIYLQVTKGGF